MKKLKIAGIIIGVLGSITIIISGFGANYLYNLTLNPHVSKDAIFDPEINESAAFVTENSTSGPVTEEEQEWVLNHENLEHLYITSHDGLKLHNYVLTQPDSHKWVINVHGYSSEGIRMSSYAQQFHNMGYNVMIPDLRGHGTSEGDYIGMGWDERLDIIDLINHIVELDPQNEIVLFGVSMGAATVMNTSGEVLPPNVKAVIEDCGYTSTWDEFSYQLDSMFGLPSFPLLHTASLFSKIRAGYWIREGSPIEQIQKSTTPTLFIHGDTDSFVPYEMLDELYEVSPVEKEKLIIEGAEHGRAQKVNPELYWSTISAFLDKYISNQ